jgi:Predicted integral membrane protein
MIPLAFSLHVLSATIWVGGMFFAYVILRPVAATQFEPAQRLTLWSQVFFQILSLGLGLRNTCAWHRFLAYCQ